MPRMRPGYRQLTTIVPTELFERIGALADANGRSRADEVIHALARHLEAPPRVRVVVETPPAPDAEVIKGAGTPRGRPRKKAAG